MYHIFICDDEKRFTEVLEKRVETCLKEQGQSYEIQIFYNGIEMFQAMQKKAPEILLFWWSLHWQPLPPMQALGMKIFPLQDAAICMHLMPCL